MLYIPLIFFVASGFTVTQSHEFEISLQVNCNSNLESNEYYPYIFPISNENYLLELNIDVNGVSSNIKYTRFCIILYGNSEVKVFDMISVYFTNNITTGVLSLVQQSSEDFIQMT